VLLEKARAQPPKPAPVTQDGLLQIVMHVSKIENV
jgi:hypothetical protein